MVDALFADPRLTPLYDAFDGDRDDLDTYVAVAGEVAAQRVLDVGCGTGCLAIRLAAGGRTVIGADPAAASLDVARSKLGAERVTWIDGDATAVPSIKADLAVMTGNVAQVFLTDEEWSQTLNSIRAALRQRGSIAFETRRPEDRAWEKWAASQPVVLDLAGIGAVERRLELSDVDLPFVSFRFTYQFLADGSILSSDSTLRFRSRAEVETSLIAHGFRVVDVRDASDRPAREFVFLAERVD